jgi:hypothetical protein
MKLKALLLIVTLFFMGCASYKQLKPEPEITILEREYIELKDDGDNFELDKDKKYFITFPPPVADNYYLLLQSSYLGFLNTYLTNAFDDGKGTIIKIKDESGDPGNLIVYPIDKSVQNFYWVIEYVRQDMELELNYRYVEKWRFKFESKYTEFQGIFADNKVDSSVYKSIGVSLNFEGFNFYKEISAIEIKSENLNNLKKELLEIESIFPANIVNTNDQSYRDYVDLKNKVDNELRFHNDYLMVLKVFKLESESRSDIVKFSGALPDFLDFLDQKDRFPQNILDEAKEVLGSRLSEVMPFFEKELPKKNNADRIDFDMVRTETLYDATGKIMPPGFTTLAGFVNAYNQRADALKSAKTKLDELQNAVKNYPQMPANNYFDKKLAGLSEIKHTLPVTGFSSFGKYKQYKCAKLLDKEINNIKYKVNSLNSAYRRADRLVPQLNTYKQQKQYRNMLKLIRQNGDLSFLKSIYKGVDQLSLDEQTRQIRTAVNSGAWQEAESKLQSLHYDDDFLNPSIIMSPKRQTVSSLENTLFARVDEASVQCAKKFISENINNIDYVEELYTNPAFLPVHELTFTSGGQSELQRRTKTLNDRMLYLKEQEFPTSAIKNLYDEFTKNTGDNGVAKARAIVTHGSHYTGDDRKIKTRVAECDPWASKWIIKAKNYRKIFALPTTSNKAGVNEYVFRLNIRIPSDAKFPVFDINIKLPKQVAKEASTSQWYKKITMNKKILKNEGRFTITSPTSANNYECQISPVRMVKDKDNILEVHFKNHSFKVFEVSVMAQKPIIKKH